jgi:hypothetical protein
MRRIGFILAGACVATLAGATPVRKGDRMAEIPPEVKEYILAPDTMTRGPLIQRHPDLPKTLADPHTRAAVVRWLASDEAWASGALSLTEGCVGFLAPHPEPAEVPIVRTFLLHFDPHVRLHAYEHLLTLYYPDKNRDAMYLLFSAMLEDQHDIVRKNGALFIRSSGAIDEFRPTLERWLKLSPGRGWQRSDAHAIIEQLVGKP